MTFKGYSLEGGTLHHYAPGLVAYEYPHQSDPGPVRNHLIFVGGLFDGLLSTPYILSIARSLPFSWSVVQPVLSSSYKQFGTASLRSDVAEISQCIAYLQTIRPIMETEEKGTIVIMGHSTGCQDALFYVVGAEKEQRVSVRGIIMQAPVSDREAIVKELPQGIYEKSVKLAQEYVESGRGEDILPASQMIGVFPAPLTARRWLSLASPGPEFAGEDDMFSSDLGDERLQELYGVSGLGGSGVRSAFLMSEKDEYVPDWMDKEGTLRKWKEIIIGTGGEVDQSSGIVQGATHNYGKSEDTVVEDLVNRVVGFLNRTKPGN